VSPVIRAADVNREERGEFVAAGIATPSLGAQESIVCWVKSPPGWSGRAHSHDREEIVVIVQGNGAAFLNDDRIEVSAGDVVVVPAGTLHSFEAGPDGLESMTVEPAGIRFFDPDGHERPMPSLML
jgi:quercetin dioxygenase-like cupin family protein